MIAPFIHISANQNNNVIQSNGKLDEKRTSITNNGGLNVPGSKTDKAENEGRTDSPRSDRSHSVDSRRGSSRSIESRLSAIDFSKISGVRGYLSYLQFSKKERN